MSFLYIAFKNVGLLLLILNLYLSLDSVSAKPEAIDWEFYSKNISKPGLVSSFQKAVSWLWHGLISVFHLML